MLKHYEELEEALVDLYNKLRPFLYRVPPFDPLPIPEAKIQKDCNKEELKDKIIFDIDHKFFLQEKHEDSPMAYIYCRGVIKVNSRFYCSPDVLKSRLSWFPLLHEMVHVKHDVFRKNNSVFKHENFPDFDFTRVKKLFEDLQSGKDESRCEMFREDGINIFVLCDFLAQETQELLKGVIGEGKIEASEQINWLTENLYWFNNIAAEWEDKVGMLKFPIETPEEL